MADSALVVYVDDAASAAGSPERFMSWSAWLSELVAGREIVLTRLPEWSVYRAATTGDTDRMDDLLAGSNWLQLKVAEESASSPVVAELAESGRTKRIRGTARSRLGGLKRRLS